MADKDDKIAHSGDYESEVEEREGWGKKIDFLLSCVGFAVGFGNLWRFPYLCYKYGGGAFLIPYVLSLVICGIPLMALEFGIGQYFMKGPTVAFEQICPLFSGTGFSMVLISFFVAIYYVVILAWVLYFLVASFITPLPWTTCNNSWNTASCLVRNGSNTNASGTSPSVEYFNNRVLNMTTNPNDAGPVKWDLALLLILAWVIVYLCIFKGVKWTGKVVYFTATFPYLILIILFIRGVTLDGAAEGIRFYLQVDISKLASADPWREAGTQIFYSLGAGFGSLIAFSSYNKRNNSLLRDAVTISCINCGTSFFGGFVIFSMLGYMAKQQQLPVGEVVSQGPGLVFMVYPAGLATLPGSNFWSIIFFFMLITLGLDSQFAMVEAVVTGLTDYWPKTLLKRKPWLIAGLCVVMFLIGLTCVTKGGFYVFDLFNFYSAGTGLIVTVMFEICIVSYVYGVKRFRKNIARVTEKPVWIPWPICWVLLTPIMILSVFIFSIVYYSPITYSANGKPQPYPWWGEFIGWLMAVLCISAIILPAIYKLYRADGTFMERLQKLMFVPLTDEEVMANEPYGVSKAMEEKPFNGDTATGPAFISNV